MPVVVTLRDGEEVEFETDDADYAIDEVGILHVSGTAHAAFQPPAWSYVIKKSAEKAEPPLGRECGGHLQIGKVIAHVNTT